jgi:putative lipoprotein
MAQEAAFLAALGMAERFEIRGERLQLRATGGALALDLVSAVTGTVTYRVRRALPPEAEIRVSLLDISLADAPARVIAEQVSGGGDGQVPLPFRIVFDPAEIETGRAYGLRATIMVGDRLLFTSTRAYPVITGDHPRYDVEIEVEPAGS